MIFDEERSCSKQILLDLNEDFDLNGFFNESLKQSILGALRFPIKELIFENYPITHADFDTMFQTLKEDYEGNINIVDTELDPKKFVKRVTIQIQLPKNTHYIQQAYLRNFSSNSVAWNSHNRKEKARIFVFNKHKNSIITIGNTPKELKLGQKIKSIAKESEFYSLALEQLMRRVHETFSPPIFDKLIKNPRIVNLTGVEKEILVDYIILTWLRTKEERKILEELYGKMVKKFAEDAKGKKLPNIRVEVDSEYLKKLHEEMMLTFLLPESENHKIISNHLLNLRWKIIKTKFPHTFLTSDNPVVFFNSHYEKEKKNGNDFINKQIENSKKHLDFINWQGFIEVRGRLGKAPTNKGVEIYLPISPAICLCLFDIETTKTPLTPRKINREIILQADEYVFSHHDRLNFVKKIISKNPGCVDRDGNRQELRASFKYILKSLESLKI